MWTSAEFGGVWGFLVRGSYGHYRNAVQVHLNDGLWSDVYFKEHQQDSLSRASGDDLGAPQDACAGIGAHQKPETISPALQRATRELRLQKAHFLCTSILQAESLNPNSSPKPYNPKTQPTHAHTEPHAGVCARRLCESSTVEAAA